LLANARYKKNRHKETAVEREVAVHLIVGGGAPVGTSRRLRNHSHQDASELGGRAPERGKRGRGRGAHPRNWRIARARAGHQKAIEFEFVFGPHHCNRGDGRLKRGA
jgi:hypothetical protein